MSAPPSTATAANTRPRFDSALVKQRARALGADLVGIASAATLNAFPPDPRWPQTPERISPYCKSVVVIAQRIPAGAFRCKTNTPVQYIDILATDAGNDALRVSIEIKRGASADGVAQELRDAVKQQFELTPEIVLLDSGTLAREFESAIKAPRFADRRS